jgi:Type II secretion system (T2SS), protein E, N-terminal domain
LDRTPLGELCLAMGLLRTGDVDVVLQELQARGHGRFGEIAVELGLLTDADVAQALARQYQLVYIDDERVARLTIAHEVLDLLPPHLLRERLLVPTFLDPDQRIVSLLTADPTDLPTLHAAQTTMRAHQLRLFVATPRSLLTLLDRLVPRFHGMNVGPQARLPRAQKVGVVVLEPDVGRLSALRRLALAEGAVSVLATDPEQVTATLEAGQADRVVMRRDLADLARPYLGVWSRARPGVRVATIDGYGPGQRPVVDHIAYRNQLLAMIDVLIVSQADPEQAQGIRALRRLVQALGAHAQLPIEHRDAMELAAVLRSMDQLPAWHFAAGQHPRGAAAAAFMATGDPLGIRELLDAVAQRATQPAGPGFSTAVEMLHTAFTAHAAGVNSAADAEALSDNGHRWDAVEGLANVLRNRDLQVRIAAAGEAPRALVMAGCDPATATWLEAALTDAGFGSRRVADPTTLAREASDRPTLAVLVGVDDETFDWSNILAELAANPATASLPVLILGEPQAALPEEAEVVHIPRPVDPTSVVRMLRWEVSRRAQGGGKVDGELVDLGLYPLLQQLIDGRHTADVVVRTPTDDGRIALAHGELRSARFRGQVGMTALAGLMGATSGAWTVGFHDPGDGVDLSGHAIDLLNEARQRAGAKT